MFFIFLFITILSSIRAFNISSKNDKKRNTKLVFSLSLSWMYSILVDRLLLSMNYNERMLVILTFISAIILFLSILLLIFDYDRKMDRTDDEISKWKWFFK